MRALLLPLLLSASFAAQADSFTSSASSAGSASVASLSDSISDSSDSSSGDDDKKSKKSKAQAGAYTVTQLARLDDGRVALRLAGVAGLAGAAQHGSGEVAPAAITLTLRLPAAVAVEQDLQTGQTLHLLARPYGLAVARASDATPFFLAVDDRLRRDHESVKL